MTSMSTITDLMKEDTVNAHAKAKNEFATLTDDTRYMVKRTDDQTVELVKETRSQKDALEARLTRMEENIENVRKEQVARLDSIESTLAQMQKLLQGQSGLPTPQATR